VFDTQRSSPGWRARSSPMRCPISSSNAVGKH
jgi:hypothetical protein